MSVGPRSLPDAPRGPRGGEEAVREIVDGAFPPRTCIERAEGVEILRLRLEVQVES